MIRFLTALPRFLSRCVFLLDGPVEYDAADADKCFARAQPGDSSDRSGAEVFRAHKLWPAVKRSTLTSFDARRPGLCLERRGYGLRWRKLRND